MFYDAEVNNTGACKTASNWNNIDTHARWPFEAAAPELVRHIFMARSIAQKVGLLTATSSEPQTVCNYIMCTRFQNLP